MNSEVDLPEFEEISDDEDFEEQEKKSINILLRFVDKELSIMDLVVRHPFQRTKKISMRQFLAIASGESGELIDGYEDVICRDFVDLLYDIDKIIINIKKRIKEITADLLLNLNRYKTAMNSYKRKVGVMEVKNQESEEKIRELEKEKTKLESEINNMITDIRSLNLWATNIKSVIDKYLEEKIRVSEEDIVDAEEAVEKINGEVEKNSKKSKRGKTEMSVDYEKKKLDIFDDD